MRDLTLDDREDEGEDHDDDSEKSSLAADISLGIASSSIYATESAEDARRPITNLREESVYEAGLRVMKSHRAKDAVRFTFLPRKYGMIHTSDGSRKESQLFQALGITDLYVLDPDFMAECQNRLFKRRLKCEEEEDTRRAQEWARRYCVWKRLFEKSVDHQKVHRCLSACGNYPYTNRKSNKPYEKSTTEEEVTLEKQDKIGFNYEIEVEDKLNGIHDVTQLYDAAMSLLLGGPEFPNFTIIKLAERQEKGTPEEFGSRHLTPGSKTSLELCGFFGTLFDRLKSETSEGLRRETSKSAKEKTPPTRDKSTTDDTLVTPGNRCHAFLSKFRH